MELALNATNPKAMAPGPTKIVLVCLEAEAISALNAAYAFSPKVFVITSFGSDFKVLVTHNKSLKAPASLTHWSSLPTLDFPNKDAASMVRNAPINPLAKTMSWDA